MRKTVLIVHKEGVVQSLAKIYKDTEGTKYLFLAFTSDMSKLPDLSYDEVLYFNTKDICLLSVKDKIELNRKKPSTQVKDEPVVEDKPTPKPKRQSRKKVVKES